MAIDFNGALTLADQAAISNDPLVKEITKSLHQTWNALKDIPLYTSPSLKQIGVRYLNSGIPSPNWTGVNSEPVAVKGRPKSYEEQMYLIRNKILVDHVLLDQPTNIIDPIEAQVQIFLEGFSYDFNDKFINNNPLTGNIDCFPGLAYRMENYNDFDIPQQMTINAPTNSAAIDLTNGTAAKANAFFSYLQQLLDNMNAPDGDGVVLYMSEKCKRQVEFAIRLMGIGAGFDVTRDSYDRPVEKFKNATVRVVGRKADGTTSIISDTQTVTNDSESNAITAGKASSIYAVRYGTGYAQGWQSGPFKPTYLGLSKENGIMHNVVFDWGIGLWIPHTRAVGRLNCSVTP
jgi:hypothetical protein